MCFRGGWERGVCSSQWPAAGAAGATGGPVGTQPSDGRAGGLSGGQVFAVAGVQPSRGSGGSQGALAAFRQASRMHRRSADGRSGPAGRQGRLPSTVGRLALRPPRARTAATLSSPGGRRNARGKAYLWFAPSRPPPRFRGEGKLPFASCYCSSGGRVGPIEAASMHERSRDGQAGAAGLCGSSGGPEGGPPKDTPPPRG